MSHARDKTVILLSFPFSYTNLSFLFKKKYCAKFYEIKIHEVCFFFLWPLPFPTLLIHDKINAGNLIFPPISKELPTKGKIKEQSVGGFFCRDSGGRGGGGGKGAVAGVNYLNPFMPRKLYLSSCDVRNLASCA